jgi:hypothetical protein
MPRTAIQAATVAELMAQETGTMVAYIAVIDHDDLAAPLRITNNSEDISVNGVTYTAVGFDITLPQEKDDQFTRAKIVMNNADQWFTPTLRAMSGGFTVDISIVSLTNESATPPAFDNIEVSFLTFDLIGIEYDAQQVRGDLSYESFSGNQFPWGTFNPTDFPGCVSA